MQEIFKDAHVRRRHHEYYFTSATTNAVRYGSPASACKKDIWPPLTKATGWSDEADETLQSAQMSTIHIGDDEIEDAQQVALRHALVSTINSTHQRQPIESVSTNNLAKDDFTLTENLRDRLHTLTPKSLGSGFAEFVQERKNEWFNRGQRKPLYRPLRNGTTIRIQELHPGKFANPVVCNFRHVTLQQQDVPMEYDALSYVWNASSNYYGENLSL